MGCPSNRLVYGIADSDHQDMQRRPPSIQCEDSKANLLMRCSNAIGGLGLGMVWSQKVKGNSLIFPGKQTKRIATLSQPTL